jgi:hypothetical protein
MALGRINSDCPYPSLLALLTFLPPQVIIFRMTFLRFLMLLSLVAWIGGLIFFPVVAQTAFSVLPTRQLAGLVVRHSLGILHWMGFISGFFFLISSLLYNRFSDGSANAFALRHILIAAMLSLTLISQFGIVPRMDALRASIPGEIDSVPPDHPARARFDGLHLWSTRVEQGVLLLGLVLVYLTARQKPQFR